MRRRITRGPSGCRKLKSRPQERMGTTMARKGNWAPGSPEILDRGATGTIHGVNQPKAQPAGVQAQGQGVYTQRTGCLAWLLGGALVLLALVTMGAGKYVEPPADQCCSICG